jgi:hypothetical protein
MGSFFPLNSTRGTGWRCDVIGYISPGKQPIVYEAVWNHELVILPSHTDGSLWTLESSLLTGCKIRPFGCGQALQNKRHKWKFSKDDHEEHVNRGNCTERHV